MQLNQLYKLLIKQLTVFGPLGDPGAPAQWRAVEAHRHGPARARIRPHSISVPPVQEVTDPHKIATLIIVQVCLNFLEII